VGPWKGKRVAVLGLSFKPNTDDLREAPSLKVIPMLLEAGAIVRGYDPMADAAAKAYFISQKLLDDKQFMILPRLTDTLKDADVIFVLVEWPELVTMNPMDVAALVKPTATLIDCRDQYQSQQIEAAGLGYIGIGV
jgi:UDPglucose 6-dehydrogenase